MKKALLLAGFVAGLCGPLWAETQSTVIGDDQESVIAGDLDVAAADPLAGEEIYQSVCKNCHGPSGKGMASFPKLAGNEADFIVSRLIAYRDREMVGPNSPLMWSLAEELSDQDIVDITTFITTEFE